MVCSQTRFQDKHARVVHIRTITGFTLDTAASICDREMVSRQELVDGYDCQWVEEPPVGLLCLVCRCVARDSRQHGSGGCGKVFCHSCIIECQKVSTSCPNCRMNLTGCIFKDEKSKNETYIHYFIS